MAITVTMRRQRHPFPASGTISPGQPDPTKPVVDLAAYPILTEEVGYPPSPLATPSTGVSAPPSGAPGGSIGAIATKALNDVLGWKLKLDDPTSFVGALNQSFSLSLVEGHVESKWTPRTYAVQTDLAGGITGAQAAIYFRAKDALDQSLPLLDGLYALNPDANPETVAALREILRTQMTELVNELGVLGGPRVSRVNQYFWLILAASAGSVGTDTIGPVNTSIPPPLQADPDQIQGTLGQFRRELAVYSYNYFTKTQITPPPPNPWVNTIEDEQNVTNYRILSDYLTSLLVTWQNNYNFFLRVSNPTMPQAFLGTQLVLISRQLSVVAEAVNEVRFTMDSVFLGPAERETLLLEFPSTSNAAAAGAGVNESMFVEELLRWIESFSTDEGVNLIQNAGKLGLGRGFIDVVQKFINVTTAAMSVDPSQVPRAYFAPRVQLAWQFLNSQLSRLSTLAVPVALTRIPPEFGTQS
jgi:hypothetical protein